MTANDLITLLSLCNPDADVYVDTPDNSDDFFIDGVDEIGDQVHIQTAS